MPEWLKGTDCKSVNLRLHRFKSYSTHFNIIYFLSKPNICELLRPGATIG